MIKNAIRKYRELPPEKRLERKRYGISVVFGAIVYYIIFAACWFILKELGKKWDDWYPIAVVTSLAGNVLSNYLSQKYWVFKGTTKKKILHGAFRYFVSTVLFIGLNCLLVWAFVESTGVYVWFAGAVVAIALMPLSFVINKKILAEKETAKIFSNTPAHVLLK